MAKKYDDIYDAKEAGQRIKAERMRRSMTVRALSYMTGVGEAALNKYENEGFTPNLKAAYAIAKALNLTLEYIMGVDGAKMRYNRFERLGIE